MRGAPLWILSRKCGRASTSTSFIDAYIRRPRGAFGVRLQEDRPAFSDRSPAHGRSRQSASAPTCQEVLQECAFRQSCGFRRHVLRAAGLPKATRAMRTTRSCVNDVSDASSRCGADPAPARLLKSVTVEVSVNSPRWCAHGIASDGHTSHGPCHSNDAQMPRQSRRQ